MSAGGQMHEKVMLGDAWRNHACRQEAKSTNPNIGEGVDEEVEPCQRCN